MKLITLLISLISFFSATFSVVAYAEPACKTITFKQLPLLMKSEHERINELDRKQNQLLSDEESILQGTDKRHLAYQKVYNDCLEPLLNKHAKLGDLSIEQLSYLFDAISHTQFYTASTEQSSVMFNLLKVLENKEGVEQDKLNVLSETMYGAFIRARQFAELDILVKKYNDLTTVDFVPAKVKSQRNIMLQKGSKATFYLEPFDLSSKAQVVVVSNPYCGFSQDARRYLSDNKSYRSIFSEHATWMIPADGNLYFEAVSEDPQQDIFPFVYTHRSNEWPEIDYWGTPTFYFYKDGDLKYKVTGWDKGRDKYLDQGLEKIGLL